MLYSCLQAIFNLPDPIVATFSKFPTFWICKTLLFQILLSFELSCWYRLKKTHLFDGNVWMFGGGVQENVPRIPFNLRSSNLQHFPATGRGTSTFVSSNLRVSDPSLNCDSKHISFWTCHLRATSEMAINRSGAMWHVRTPSHPTFKSKIWTQHPLQRMVRGFLSITWIYFESVIVTHFETHDMFYIHEHSSSPAETTSYGTISHPFSLH